MKKEILLYFFLSALLTASTSTLTGCASKSTTEAAASATTTTAPAAENTSPPSITLTVPAAVTAASAAASTDATGNIENPASTETVKIELKKVADLANKAAATTEPDHGNTHAATEHTHEATGVAPDVAFGWLKNGNLRFSKQYLRRDGQGKKDIQRLAEGQKPHSIVLSCSDSRVPPELVFDQKLGEIFVVRTAGQALDANAIGSIEYAIEHLGAKNLIVLGHSKCGAVKAAMGTLAGGDAGSPSLNHLVQDIHPRLAEFKGLPASANLVTESWANVRGVAKDLSTRSEIIAGKIKSGEIKVHSGLYDLQSGVVDFK